MAKETDNLDSLLDCLEDQEDWQAPVDIAPNVELRSLGEKLRTDSTNKLLQETKHQFELDLIKSSRLECNNIDQNPRDSLLAQIRNDEYFRDDLEEGLTEKGVEYAELLKKQSGQKLFEGSSPRSALAEKVNRVRSKLAGPVLPYKQGTGMSGTFIIVPGTNIRVSKPLVSSQFLRQRMQDRRFIKLSDVAVKAGTVDTEGDWVTFGVIVYKVDMKETQAGKSYVVWKLSDLSSSDTTVSLFLFDSACKDHWKNIVGTVVGVLNPKWRADNSTLSVDASQKMLVVGSSADLGYCKAIAKSGKPCRSVVNKQSTEYCVYHIQNQYKRYSKGRSDLNLAFSAPMPKSHCPVGMQQPKLCNVIAQNRFTSASVSLATLKNHQRMHSAPGSLSAEAASKITMPPAHDEAPVSAAATENTAEKGFLDLLAKPTAGSTNLVKFLKGKQCVNKSKENCPQIMQSVKVSDLIKHRSVYTATKANSARPDVNQISHLKQHPKVCSSKHLNHVSSPTHVHSSSTDRSIHACRTSKSEADFEYSSTSDNVALSHYRSCGQPGSNIALGGAKLSEALKSRIAAIAKLKSSATDINQEQKVCNLGKSARSVSAVRKRVFWNTSDGSCGTDVLSEIIDQQKRPKLSFDTSNDANSVALHEEESNLVVQPKNPLSKDANNHLSADEVKRIMGARSKHAEQVVDKQLQLQDEYFGNLEKKEKLEKKMTETYEVECKVVHCPVCHYVYFSAHQSCRDAQHPLKFHTARKRFFQCANCKNRTVTLMRYPKPCTKCGESARFRKTGMWKAGKAVLLDRDKLELRGEECKFLNSLC